MQLRVLACLVAVLLQIAAPAAALSAAAARQESAAAEPAQESVAAPAPADGAAEQPGSDPRTAAPPAEESFWWRLWNREIVHLSDTESIRVSNVVVGLALLLVGFGFARSVARVVRAALLPRVHVSAGASAAIESILFYLLLLVVAYSALAVAKVPLTAFTLLGGAAAIGVGFGSQTLVSNFIAGLILLLEQPIRAGDLIQIDDLYGTVSKVGARSTRVVTGENVELLVPNSVFLEQRIVNWTLSNTRVRASLSLGVAYGSPTAEVARLIRKAIDEHQRVHSTPEPIVLFTAFGDNALGFESHFWIDMHSIMERRRIVSDLRFRIDALFREAGITIAFPQRDVHLDTVRPLEVRLVQGAEPAGTE
jgi:small-conductance mechanosensitive channel